MLDRAERLLKQILSGLRDKIAADIPVVVLEPSCLAVFRDEMVNLLSDKEDAKRLSEQTFLLSEFLERRVDNYKQPKLSRQALVQQSSYYFRRGSENEMRCQCVSVGRG